VFSEWDRIFKDPMTTAAAIDRLVHHAVILEMTGSSIRIEQALAGRTDEGGNEPYHTDASTTTDNPIPGAAPMAPDPAIPMTTTPTTTPTTTTERLSTTTPQSPTTISPLTDFPIPGPAPTAPDPATSTNRTKGGSTNGRKEKIKQRVQHQRSERDGEM
jgi:hypothetical protein